jgi:hypothetical protein
VGDDADVADVGKGGRSGHVRFPLQFLGREYTRRTTALIASAAMQWAILARA